MERASVGNVAYSGDESAGEHLFQLACDLKIIPQFSPY